MSRRDDLSDLYKKSKNITKVTSMMFYLNITTAFAVMLTVGVAHRIAMILQIIVAFSFVVLSVVDDYSLWYQAEAARRKSSIESAFSIDLSEMKTDGYYNNNIEPSILKYEVNSFESSFFSKTIASKMLFGECVKSFVAIVVFIISCLLFSDSEQTLIIAQTAFSSYFVISAIGLLCYKSKLDRIYAEYYHEFVTMGISNEKQVISLLTTTIEYEAVKAYFKIRLSSKLFEDNNESLSHQWDDLSRKIRIM